MFAAMKKYVDFMLWSSVVADGACIFIGAYKRVAVGRDAAAPYFMFGLILTAAAVCFLALKIHQERKAKQ